MTPPLTPLVESIVRLERAGGLRGARLTEPGWERWHRIRRKLGWTDLLALLCEDLADAFPYPFDLARWDHHPLSGLDHEAAKAAIDGALAAPQDEPSSFLRRSARTWDLPAGGALSDLPRVQLHHRVLELGAGRLGFAGAEASGVSFHDRFVFVADTDTERAAIGLAAVEARANAPTIWPSARLADAPRFDHVWGLRGYAPAERVPPGLEIRWI